MIKKQKQIKTKGDISLTPLIDVVFILLIFFMITMSLYQIKTIKFELPKTTAISEKKNDKITKTFIVKNNSVMIGDKEIKGYKNILAYIKKNDKKNIVWGLQPDKYVLVNTYLGLWKYLYDRGIHTNIIAPKPKGAR